MAAACTKLGAAEKARSGPSLGVFKKDGYHRMGDKMRNEVQCQDFYPQSQKNDVPFTKMKTMEGTGLGQGGNREFDFGHDGSLRVYQTHMRMS